MDFVQRLQLEFDEIHRKEHCMVSDHRVSLGSSAGKSSQAQFLQPQSLSLSAPTRADEPKKHLSANRSACTILQFSVPLMPLEE
jgi:hypothetical protein